MTATVVSVGISPTRGCTSAPRRVVEVTGLRNSCAQLGALQDGSGDPIRLELPARPHRPLERI